MKKLEFCQTRHSSRLRDFGTVKWLRNGRKPTLTSMKCRLSVGGIGCPQGRSDWSETMLSDMNAAPFQFTSEAHTISHAHAEQGEVKGAGNKFQRLDHIKRCIEICGPRF